MEPTAILLSAFNIYENTVHKDSPKIQYRKRPAAISAVLKRPVKIQITNLLGAAQTINSIRKCIVKGRCFHFDFKPTNIDLLIYFKYKNYNTINTSLYFSFLGTKHESINCPLYPLSGHYLNDFYAASLVFKFYTHILEVFSMSSSVLSPVECLPSKS